MYKLTIKRELLSGFKILSCNEVDTMVVWCRCGFIRPIRFRCRWSYRVLMSCLLSLSLSFSLSLSETHYLSVTTRFPTSHLTCLHRFERERISGAIASRDLIDHHVKVSTSDRNTTDQSWKSTDFRDRAIKRRYRPRKAKENGAKVAGKTDRWWSVRRRTQSVSSRRDPQRYCENVQSVCQGAGSGRGALNALNLKLEYQPGLSI